MPDFILTLGGIGFQKLEIPESIRGGGAQQLQTHKYGNGERTVDAFGPDDGPLSWSGIFLDDTAEARCQQLDTLRKLGDPVSLVWSSFSYLVVIKEFTWAFERFYQIRYELSLEVVVDRVQPVSDVPADADNTISNDIDDSSDILAALIEIVTLAQNIIADAIDLLGLPGQIAAMFKTLGELFGLTGSSGASGGGSAAPVELLGLPVEMQAIFTTVGTLSSVTGASADQIATLQAQVYAALLTTNSILATVDASTVVAGDPANFAAGTDADSVAAAISGVAILSVTLANVFQLSNVLSRLSKNIASIQSGAPVLAEAQPIAVTSSSTQQGVTLSVSPGNMLYVIAAMVYGDAAGWALLAKANALVDPDIQFDGLLTIPSYDPDRANNGILL